MTTPNFDDSIADSIEDTIHATTKSLQLDDLNNDPSLLNTATSKQIVALNKEANDKPEYPLSGPIRYFLNAKANAIIAEGGDNGEPETTIDNSDNLSPLQRAKLAASQRS